MKEYYSENDGSFYSNMDKEENQNRRAYPIQHSASIPVKTNDPGYWQQNFYSRSQSSVSVDSVYPPSTVDNDADNDVNDVDDDENWSDTFEEVASLSTLAQQQQFPELKFQGPFGYLPQTLKPNFDSEDEDKTPVTSKRFNENDLYRVAQKLENQIPPQQIFAYPVVQEKAASATSMQNPISRTVTASQPAAMERSASRTSLISSSKKSRAPDPPVLNPEMQQQSEEIQARQMPAMSYPVSLTGGLPVKRLSRPLTPSGSLPVAESRPVMSYPVNPAPNPEPVGLAELPPTGLLRARQPSFSYPVVKNPTPGTSAPRSNPSPTRPSPNVITEKQPPFKFPTASMPISARSISRAGQLEAEERLERSGKRYDSPQPTMRSLSPTSPMLGSDTSSLSTSPSSASRCPHCKIHSWLPHSTGCPNKKN